jgi:4-hydroxy-3-methylbut-2-enyl diphosphate reductase
LIFIYFICKAILYVFLKVFNRLEVIGAENIPLKGGVIVAANHVSYMDPPVIGVALKRRATYMAREGLFKIPLLGSFIKMFAFPVRRGKPQPSTIKEAIRRLQMGELIIIFPEGSRSIDGSLLEAKRGVGILSAISRVPVVPTYIKGTEKALPVGAKLLKPAKIKVIFGKPIEFDKGTDKRLHEKISRDIIEAIKNLKGEEQRAKNFVLYANSMKVIVAKTAGFCFGVKRAIDMAFKMALEKREGVYTLGPIIHNPQVVETLRDKGIEPIEDINKKKDIKALIIRTHGIPLNLSKKIISKGYEIIDATCPFVKKAQYYAKLLSKEGYQVIILGEKNHPEVKSLKSYANNDVVVTDGKAPLPNLKTKVGIIVQTTQTLETLKKVLSDALEHAKEIKVYNTICNSTTLRLKETGKMAKKVDVMFVVGGKNSANTTQLTKLCKSLSVPTYHIETSSEIRDEWIKGAKTLGITAGASTPDWIIKEVEKRIRDIGG